MRPAGFVALLAISGPGGGGGGGGSGAYLRKSVGVKEGKQYTIRIGSGVQGGRAQSNAFAMSGEDGEGTVALRGLPGSGRCKRWSWRKGAEAREFQRRWFR